MADQLSPSRGIEVDVDRAIGVLAPSADAVFLRHPALDPSCPRTSDLDFLAFAPVEELVPERLFFDAGRPVDVIWLPSASLDEPSSFAKQGVLPHRLLTSRIVSDPAGTFEGKAALVAEATFDASIQAERIAGFLDLGFLTVREIGINWDAPEIALFYLHMAYAACLAALADAARTYAPNLYTRPFDYVPPLEAETGLDLTSEAVPGLGLEDDLEAIAAALLRLHGVLAARFPEPVWPATMRASTRAEYRYFLDRREIAWRIEVAREMAQRGNARNGVFYLRLLAYSLARIPSVHRHAIAGEDASFLRPRYALGRELARLCPEIVDDLTRVLGREASVARVEIALGIVERLRREVLSFVEAGGLRLAGLRDWVPFHKREDPHVENRLDM